ncbi:MAG: hypothetical protein LBU90_03345 [Bacteroidales bacterium]|jgi:hypothetical protein|nr:hypothetical protein [Bacteroidales bacterium]
MAVAIKKVQPIKKTTVRTNNKSQRGYLSHSEFWTAAKHDIDKLCAEYGILQ